MFTKRRARQEAGWKWCDDRGLPHGVYYEAPDSARPIPQSVFDRIDPDAVIEEAQRLIDRGGLEFTEKGRAILVGMGAPAVDQMLADFGEPPISAEEREQSAS